MTCAVPNGVAGPEANLNSAVVWGHGGATRDGNARTFGIEDSEALNLDFIKDLCYRVCSDEGWE